ncbi:MAG: putative toxin-antitoxin system toxin component, PIN family [Bacteroidales bacterium]|nr:putative toxin-antitoxin system toxin component, PIN family [Bacteroidales bacterium]
MEKSSYRVIIDSNIWISFLIGKSLSGLVDNLSSGKIRVILSPFQIDELILVLTRPKFHKYFKSSDIIEFLQH